MDNAAACNPSAKALTASSTSARDRARPAVQAPHDADALGDVPCFTRADRVEATYTEHAKILRAVIQRKVDQAVLLLKSHIEQGKAEVRKITLATLHDAGSRKRR